MFNRRKTDKPQRILTASELVAEGMRDLMKNPNRRATDILGEVRARAEDARRDAERSPQLELFAA